MSVQVRPHPTKGRALHALQPYQPGALILSLEPLLLLPSRTLLPTLCAYCLRPATRPCAGCRAAYYCDRTCQTAAWAAVHSRECGALRRNMPDEGRRRALPTPVRALIQALLSPRVAEGLRDLEGHVNLRMRDQEEWGEVVLMATGASAYAGRGTGGEAVRRACELLSKIEMNAFQRSDTDMGLTGIFLEPTLAMANHSCVPNALVQFVGRKAYLRAGQPIQPGDEIEITYAAVTDPLPLRKQALSRYKFECGCRRCQADLNVYQVAALPPYPDLDASSTLLTDPSDMRHHPALTSPDKLSAARRHCKPTSLADSSADHSRQALQDEYTASAPLVKEELWAVAPLPDVVTAVSVYYFDQGNRPFALATACFFATACDPYRYPQPFHAMRLNGLLAVAKLLSNTAAETAALTDALTTMAAKASLDQKVQQTLGEIDQVSLCQMLLIMILRSTPAEYRSDWEVSARAQDMLNDIDQLPGRDEELSLINVWKRDPNSDTSRAFFEYAVVQRVQALADLGRAALKLDFGA